MPTPKAPSIPVSVRFTPEQRAWIESHASHGIGPSQVVRLAVQSAMKRNPGGICA